MASALCSTSIPSVRIEPIIFFQCAIADGELPSFSSPGLQYRNRYAVGFEKRLMGGQRIPEFTSSVIILSPFLCFSVSMVQPSEFPSPSLPLSKSPSPSSSFPRFNSSTFGVPVPMSLRHFSVPPSFSVSFSFLTTRPFSPSPSRPLLLQSLQTAILLIFSS
jgi:hypothetical protein